MNAKRLRILKVGLTAGNYIYVKVVLLVPSTPLGQLKDFQQKISIGNSVTPVIQPFRHVPFALRHRVEKQIKELLSQDIMEPVSISLWFQNCSSTIRRKLIIFMR